MNQFEMGLLRYISRENLKTIQNTKIGIAGAGGLGSNCAQILVRCGFKKMLIVDFDTVDYSNLNRQYFSIDQVGQRKVDALRNNLAAINPSIEVQVSCTALNGGNLSNIFYDCQVIVEAVDCPQLKKALVEAYINSTKLIVAASGVAGYGQSDCIKVNRAGKNLYIVGDMSSGTDTLPPLAPYVCLTAAKQADVVLDYVLSKKVVKEYEYFKR